MNKILLSLVLLFPLSLSAEIYVVDMQKVLSDSKAGKEAKSSLEGKFKTSKDRLENERQDLIKMQEDVKKQSSLLSEDALQKKVSTIQQKQKDIARSLQDYQEEFARENNAKIGKIVTAVEEIIDDLAAENNYPIILEKNQRIVLFAAEKYDLTDEVVKRLNQRN